jgi:hypothetical protein
VSFPLAWKPYALWEWSPQAWTATERRRVT